jgi:hypothetical protein
MRSAGFLIFLMSATSSVYHWIRSRQPSALPLNPERLATDRALQSKVEAVSTKTIVNG